MLTNENGILTKNNKLKLMRVLQNKDNISQNSSASKFHLSQQCVSKTFKRIGNKQCE